MSEQSAPYNQIDFIIKAPVFRIVFSYMDDKGVAFVREYLLRLLKLTPLKPEQIARYFGFNQHETEVALADLEQNKWISWQDDGSIVLSKEGEHLFDSNNESNSPKIPTLKEFSDEYRMELLDNNFFHKKDSDTLYQNAIELSVEPKILSECKEIARKSFQNRFLHLIEENIVDKKGISLYKIDVIEQKNWCYFRFTQAFEILPTTGEAKEQCDIAQLFHQNNIQQAITEKINSLHADNWRELCSSMAEIGDEDSGNILSNGQLDFSQFLKILEKYEQKKGLYFLGQIYHHEQIFEKIKKITDKLDKQSSYKCYWLAPSDIYWGKQRKIHDKIQSLIDQLKQKNYDFRLYLPLPPEKNKHEKQEWQREFKDLSDKKILYGFREGFLNGNTEILFLENQFAVVCYHAQLSAYPVTLPIGFMTTKKEKVKHIQNLVEKYLSSIKYISEEPQENDFGKLTD